MGVKSSKSGVLPGYLCCPSRLEEFCDALADSDKDHSEKRAQLKTLLENPIKPHVEPYVGKFFLLCERWEKEDGVRMFIKNVVKHNQCKPVLTRLFKSMLLMYGRDCISLHVEPCSAELNSLVSDCFIELFKAGFSCQKLLSEGGGCCWFVNCHGEVRATYCPLYTRVACWAKFIKLFIQATHEMDVMHQIWREVAPHLAYCSHVPSVAFKTQCQFALYCQTYSSREWSFELSRLCDGDNPDLRGLSVPLCLVNCCVGVIRTRFRAPNVFFALDRMPILPPRLKDQLLLKHVFTTENVVLSLQY